MHKLKLSLLSFILLFSLSIQGQKLDKLLNVKYQPGFAILNSGDTLIGAFEFNDCEQNYRFLVYIDPVSQKKRVYEPQKIKYFNIDTLYFLPKELKDGWFFVRIILNDSLKVFLHKHFFTTDISSGAENQIMYEKPNGEYLMVSYDNFFPFNKRVGDFFSDDPKLYKKITNNTYTKNDILKIATEYNDWLRNNKR
jgi:hypothetical protein